MRLFLAALILPVGLCADPISITVLNQTEQTGAEAIGTGQLCMISGSSSATCQLQGVSESGATLVASSTATSMGTSNIVLPFTTFPPLGLFVSASTNAIGYPTAASASASLDESILISGGVGAGYLELAFGTNGGYGDQRFTTKKESLNGTVLNVPGLTSSTLFFVIPFQFGQSIDIGLSVSTGADYSINGAGALVSLSEMRIYSHAPTGCNVSNPCSDPNFTPVLIPSLIATPEPSSALLAAMGLIACSRIRRRRSR
jgi:hypothetical protein